MFYCSVTLPFVLYLMIRETRLYTITLNTLDTPSLLSDIFQPLWPPGSNLYELVYNCYIFQSLMLLPMCDYFVILSMPTILTLLRYVKCCCTKNVKTSKRFPIFSPCWIIQYFLSFTSYPLKWVPCEDVKCKYENISMFSRFLALFIH